MKASSEFIEAWKKEVHEKLPVAWQHTIDRSQEITESHQRKSIKELREEADKLLGKSYKRTRSFEREEKSHDWEMLYCYEKQKRGYLYQYGIHSLFFVICPKQAREVNFPNLWLPLCGSLLCGGESPVRQPPYASSA